MKILMVLTSHDAREAGAGALTLEDFAAPYYVFKDAGARIALASPRGGETPLSAPIDAQAPGPAAARRFAADRRARTALARTLSLADVKSTGCDAVFYPGGQGCLWDLAEDPASIALITALFGVGKASAFVGHGVGALRHVRTTDGAPVTQGRDVTGPPASEEASARLPFPVENMLTSSGARYTKGAKGAAHVVIDGILITAQNSASSAPAARALLKRLGCVPKRTLRKR